MLATSLEYITAFGGISLNIVNFGILRIVFLMVML